MESVMKIPVDQKLTVKQLAEALYEGTPHLQNLAETMARQHGQVGGLTWFAMMPEDVQNYFFHIAQQLIDFGKGWTKNEHSATVLTPEFKKLIAELPRHTQLKS